ncbi:MAG: hypothetical protein CVT77_14945 [Alphaproteobacteria bacterium HGW-Alphaproteobacteria-16]|nr:MAG: hypothetical protein CVT77_14945 [Alphaproteobacteria bacterium HGW-Alphaproteobacteria-16]
MEGAFGLFREHLSAVAIWAGVYLAGNIAILLVTMPILRGAMSPETMADPAQMMASMLPVYLLNMLMAVVGVVLYTAAMRAVLRPQAGGLAFMRLGMDELRMIGLLILFGIIGFVVGLVLTLVLGVLGMGVAVGSESPMLSVLLSFVIGLGLLAFFIFFLVRFSLAFPLTLHRQRIVVGEAWTLSRGRFWTLFGAALVITLIGMFLSIVAASFAVGGYLADIMAAAGDPEAAAQVAERQIAAVGSLGPAMILQTIASAVIGAIWIALTGGSTATAAKLLLDSEFDNAEDVFG